MTGNTARRPQTRIDPITFATEFTDDHRTYRSKNVSDDLIQKL